MTKQQATDPSAHQAIAMEVLRQFRIIFGAIRHHFSEIESACGISGSQLWLLQEVARCPDIGVSALAKLLSIHQTTCSLLVDRLVKAGYVKKTRSTKDQRRVGLTVTTAGRGLLRRAPGPAEGMLPMALRTLPDVGLRTLHVNLAELIGNMQAKDAGFADVPLADL